MQTNNPIDPQFLFLEALRETIGNASLASKKCKIDLQYHEKWLLEDEEYRRQVYEIERSVGDYLSSKTLGKIQGSPEEVARYLDSPIVKKPIEPTIIGAIDTICKSIVEGKGLYKVLTAYAIHPKNLLAATKKSPTIKLRISNAAASIVEGAVCKEMPVWGKYPLKQRNEANMYEALKLYGSYGDASISFAWKLETFKKKAQQSKIIAYELPYLK